MIHHLISEYSAHKNQTKPIAQILPFCSFSLLSIPWVDFWIDFAYSVGDVNWVDFGDDDGGGGDFGGDGEDLEFQKDPYSKEIHPNQFSF